MVKTLTFLFNKEENYFDKKGTAHPSGVVPQAPEKGAEANKCRPPRFLERVESCDQNRSQREGLQPRQSESRGAVVRLKMAQKENNSKKERFEKMSEKKKIQSFYIGCETGSGMEFNDEESFIRSLREKIREAAKNGHTQFDVTIEPSN